MEEVIVEEEVYIDEEIIYSDDDELRLPGISEEEEEVEEDDGEIHEELVDDFHESSVYSVTEVEVDEDGNFSEVLEEEGTEVEVEEVDLSEGATEVTLSEQGLEIEDEIFTNQCHVTMPSFPHNSDATKPSTSTDDEETAPEDVDDDEEEEDDGVSSEELAEAIEYILRQERAVSRFILTEEQAQTMMTLPRKVMKVIVDHLEMCDNDGTDIDWDFLLKIVLPFCRDSPTSDDDTDGEEPELYCVPIETSI